MSDPRYAIGQFVPPADFSPAQRREALAQIAGCPAELRRALAGLSGSALDTPYREGGWTVRQVAFHLPDSHANAYVRHRLCVTEENPTIRSYDEAAWAMTPEIAHADPELACALLDALHARWLAFLGALPEVAYARTFVHGATGTTWTLAESLALYAWHGRHHVAQITELRRRRGW